MFWRGPLIKTKASPAVVKWDSPPARDLFLHTVCARLVWLAGLADGFPGGWGVTLSLRGHIRNVFKKGGGRVSAWQAAMSLRSCLFSTLQYVQFFNRLDAYDL